MFVFQCLIGCRVEDLMRLTKSNIVNGAIEYVPGKTKDEMPKPVRVILSKKAKSILTKYELPDGKLLPVISPQKYNDGIKDLFKKVELERKVVRLNPLTGKEETVKLCDIASSHMARRTFIGILHRTHKNEVIAAMSGHKKDSRAFARYYDIDDEVKAEAITDLD
jgi:integrase